MSEREGSDPSTREEGTDADADRSGSAFSMPEDSAADSGESSDDGPGETRDDGGRFGAERPVAYLMWAGVAVLAVTALVALFGFYTGVSRAISVWVSRSYRPLVNAAFNLALLLAALGGIGLLLRGQD